MQEASLNDNGNSGDFFGGHYAVLVMLVIDQIERKTAAPKAQSWSARLM